MPKCSRIAEMLVESAKNADYLVSAPKLRMLAFKLKVQLAQKIATSLQRLPKWLKNWLLIMK